ncbi:MAG TPA: C-GCAxxG-C-C family (seleno)protein [Paludibacteraceae bacterium]|nr:C-GCAxxG-C-C family (seleno)protein [Paludibacteraceae bacterium]
MNVDIFFALNVRIIANCLYFHEQMNNKKKILVLCTGNSCRSQIAEGYLRHFAGDKAEVYSAGVETHGVNPRAIAVMKEEGIDISGHTSNNVNEYGDIDFDFVITVCDNARERCPYFPAKAVKFHQNFPDPAKAQGTETEITDEFHHVRQMIKEYCKQFVEQNITKQAKAEVALSKFEEGYHCAQSVVYAFADEVNIDKNTLMSISTGFGAGIGRKQEVCGAVSGAIIILGAKYGRKENELIGKTETTYNKTQEFIDEFTKEKGTIKCSELLQGCNLQTEEGQKLFKEKDLKHEVCSKCIELACKILQKGIL